MLFTTMPRRMTGSWISTTMGCLTWPSAACPCVIPPRPRLLCRSWSDTPARLALTGEGRPVLVSDTATSDFDFPAATNAVAAQIPANIFLTQIFRGDFGNDSLAHAAVLGAFNQGALLVNYMGHSSETAWDGNLLSMDDVPLLTNGGEATLRVQHDLLDRLVCRPLRRDPGRVAAQDPARRSHSSVGWLRHDRAGRTTDHGHGLHAVALRRQEADHRRGDSPSQGGGQ